tara:strand:+ start:5192 stop:5794 length:603 start_codon:yes stop_codon:yes gene_type:complete
MEPKKRKRQRKVFPTQELQLGFMKGLIHEGRNKDRSQSIKGRGYCIGEGACAIEIAHRYDGFLWEHPSSYHISSPPRFLCWLPVEPESNAFCFYYNKINPRVFKVPRKPLNLEAHEENVSHLVSALEGFTFRRHGSDHSINSKLLQFKKLESQLVNYCSYFSLPVPEHMGADEMARKANSRKVALMITKGGQFNECPINQ